MPATTSEPDFLIKRCGISIYVYRCRVKRINLRIRRDGSVRLSLPTYLSQTDAERFVDEHLSWITEHQARVQARRTSTQRCLTPGETIELWGRPRHICLAPFGQSAVELTEHELVVPQLPQGAPTDERRRLVKAFLASVVQERVQMLMPTCEDTLHVSAGGLSVRWMRTRWGSCTPKTGRIRINAALVEHDPGCLWTVCAHELCHLVEPNHSSAFWALMDEHFAGWRRFDALLKQSSPMQLVD